MKLKAYFSLIALSLTLTLSAETIRAAFDVGSGQTKVTIAKVDENTGRPIEILFAEETVVLLGHDFKKNKGLLSDQILTELEKVLVHYRDLALKLGADELSGVATAVFRESKNGASFIQKARADLGIDLNLITQKEEGRIGFLTAVAASGKEASEVIAWDSGGGSFQITTEGKEELVVYEGPWGASKVLAAMVEKVQGKEFGKVQTANPATLSDVKALSAIVKNTLVQAKPELQAKLISRSTAVVAIGGPFSPFKMASLAIGDTHFTKELVWKALTQLVGCSDAELSRFPEPEMLIPRLTLIYTVMDHFAIHEVDYCETTGSTLGILMTPQFWGRQLVP